MVSRGGFSISDDARNVYDFERLERAVTALAEECRQRGELCARLRGEVEEQRQRIHGLEGQLLDANQKRQDVAKRVDELIAQLEHLDAEFDGAEL